MPGIVAGRADTSIEGRTRRKSLVRAQSKRLEKEASAAKSQAEARVAALTALQAQSASELASVRAAHSAAVADGAGWQQRHRQLLDQVADLEVPP